MSPLARANAVQLKPSWLIAVETPRTLNQGNGEHPFVSEDDVYESDCEQRRTDPEGKPHKTARRFDLEKDSKSRSRRSLTVQIAGYNACVTTSSTRRVYPKI